MMKTILGFLAAAVILAASPARSVDLSSLTNQEASSGLKDALSQGATKAVSMLGRTDGFLGNPKV